MNYEAIICIGAVLCIAVGVFGWTIIALVKRTEAIRRGEIPREFDWQAPVTTKRLERLALDQVADASTGMDMPPQPDEIRLMATEILEQRTREQK